MIERTLLFVVSQAKHPRAATFALYGALTECSGVGEMFMIENIVEVETQCVVAHAIEFHAPYIGLKRIKPTDTAYGVVAVVHYIYKIKSYP